MKRIILLLSIFLLSGCMATTKHAYEHYQDCEATTNSFKSLVSCGKMNRNKYCASVNECSTGGNRMVALFDALSEQVETGEISEAAARIKYLEVTGNLEADRRAREAAAWGALADSLNEAADSMSPTVCSTTGSTFGNTLSATTTCY